MIVQSEKMPGSLNHKPIVLVVDDDVAPRKMMERILTSLGYEVVSAENGLEGLEKAKSFHPDLVILDVEMPGLNGRAVCALLKEGHATCDIPILFLTGLGTVGDVEDGLKLGAEGYLSKPVDLQRFLEKVKMLLRTDHPEPSGFRNRLNQKKEPGWMRRLFDKFWKGFRSS